MQKYQKYLDTLGFNSNPFVKNVQNSQLSQIYVERSNEIEQLKLHLCDGNNVLIDGKHKMGKTFYLKTFAQNNCTNHKVFWVPTRWYGDDKEYIKMLLCTIAETVKDKVVVANEILEQLGKKNEDIAADNKSNLQLGTEDQVLNGTQDSKPKSIRELAGVTKNKHNDDVPGLVDKILTAVLQEWQKVVIIWDNFDKIDVDIQKKILICLNNAMENPNISFVLTSTLNQYSISIIEKYEFSEINDIILLDKMKTNEMKELMLNRLNSARKEPSDSIHPFTEEIFEHVYEISSGVPGYFIVNMSKLIQIGCIYGLYSFETSSLHDINIFTNSKMLFIENTQKYF